MKIKNVAFIGLGVMGYNMAGHLKKNNFDQLKLIFHLGQGNLKRDYQYHMLIMGFDLFHFQKLKLNHIDLEYLNLVHHYQEKIYHFLHYLIN